MKTACAKIGSLSGGNVLDVATGGGEFIRVLMRLLNGYSQFTGIDSSSRIIELNAESFKALPVAFETMDAAEMRFEDHSFDTVAISNSIHHLSDVDKVFDEMLRVLKPGGNLIVREVICDPGQTPPQQNHIDLHHWWARIDTICGIPHRFTHSKEELDSMIGSLPLVELESYSYIFPVQDPLHPQMIEKMTSMIDPYVERIKDHESYRELKEEGEMLKSRLKESGYAPATAMFYIGKK